MTNIVEWSKKRKLQMDQLDSLRPKHKCWVQSSPSERASVFDERMYNHLDVRSSLESAKDSNSFSQDSDTSMSVNEEVKLEEDCAKTSSFVNNVTKVEKTGSSEEDMFTDKEFNESYHDADMQALQNLEEHILGLGNCTDQLYSEYAKDSIEKSIDKEFEDILYSNGVNTNMYVLSSGRWEVNQGIRYPLDSYFYVNFTNMIGTKVLLGNPYFMSEFKYSLIWYHCL